MSDLWAYGRRPCCLVRYRHGGYNAIYPLAHGEIFEGVAATQRLERAVNEGRYEVVVAEPLPTPDNVLRFPGSSRRKSRDQTPHGGRGGKRAGPPPKSRD